MWGIDFTRLQNRWANAGARLLGGTFGGAMVEHAVFLAVVMGSMFLAVDAVGFAANRCFGQLVEVSQSKTAETGGPAAQLSVAAAAAGLEEGESPRQESGWELLTGGVTVTLGLLVWWRLYRRNGARRRSALDTEEQKSPAHVVVQDGLFLKRQSIYQLLTGSYPTIFESPLIVRQLMSPKLSTISPDVPAAQIYERMKEDRIRHLLVCDKQGRLLGVISDRDLSRPNARTAADLMTRDPLTVGPDSPVNPAVTSLIERRISCLPVLEEGKLIGVLTTTDLIVTLQCILQTLQNLPQQFCAEQAGESSASDDKNDEDSYQQDQRSEATEPAESLT